MALIKLKQIDSLVSADTGNQASLGLDKGVFVAAPASNAALNTAYNVTASQAGNTFTVTQNGATVGTYTPTLPLDIAVQSGVVTGGNLILTLTNSSTVTVPLSDLVPVQTANSASIVLSGDGTTATPLKADGIMTATESFTGVTALRASGDQPIGTIMQDANILPPAAGSTVTVAVNGILFQGGFGAGTQNIPAYIGTARDVMWSTWAPYDIDPTDVITITYQYRDVS
jgi:hypothetical protein